MSIEILNNGEEIVQENMIMFTTVPLLVISVLLLYYYKTSSYAHPESTKRLSILSTQESSLTFIKYLEIEDDASPEHYANLSLQEAWVSHDQSILDSTTSNTISTETKSKSKNKRANSHQAANSFQMRSTDKKDHNRTSKIQRRNKRVCPNTSLQGTRSAVLPIIAQENSY